MSINSDRYRKESDFIHPLKSKNPQVKWLRKVSSEKSCSMVLYFLPNIFSMYKHFGALSIELNSMLPLSISQMLRWMWRWSVCPVAVSRGHMPFCSTQQEPHQANPSHSGQVTHRPGNQLTLCSLLDMGFSETQAKEMHEGAMKSHGKHFPSVLTALLLLGLNPSSILKIMQKCPEVYSLKGADLQQRIDHLRKMGLVEGDASCPLVNYNAVPKFGVSKICMIKVFFIFFCETLILIFG